MAPDSHAPTGTWHDGFRALADLSPDVVATIDRDGLIRFVGRAAAQVFGRAPEELVGRPFTSLMQPEDVDAWRAALQARRLPSDLLSATIRHRRADGSVRVLEVRAQGGHGGLAAHDLIVSTRDVSRHVESERNRTQVERAFRVLGAVNAAVIHAVDESSLLDVVCRAAVELGGYRMAWVGFAEDDHERRIRPAARAGHELDFLERVRVTWGDDDHGRGPTGTAVRTGRPQVNRDFLTNPRTAPWREEAGRRGFRSSIALPLCQAGRTWGALTIYASEPEAFNDVEVTLLGELADNLAFGIVTLRAAAEHRIAQAAIARLAYVDPLTGLPNRARLLDRLGSVVSGLSDGGPSWLLMTLDIDAFTDIQIGIGVANADELLRQVADHLRATLPGDAFLARTGDDLFCVVVQGDAACAAEQARLIERSLARRFVQAGLALDVRMNMGASIAPAHGRDTELLLGRSTMAARRAKQRGVGFMAWSGETGDGGLQALALASELRDALAARQLLLHYQPKVDAEDGRVCGVEALVRWRHPVRGLVPPGEFIPVAERTALITPLTWYVLDEALRQCAAWRRDGLALPVAVNVSARNLDDPQFVERLVALLERHALPPRLLQLEITESVLMNEPASTHGLLDRLREVGVLVSIDDFGTGYSSLSYIATLPIQALKIDRSFVARMLDSSRVHAVVKATISLARALGIGTVAEGVERPEQVAELVAMGCNEFQGYFFSPALDADALRAWVAAFEFPLKIRTRTP